MRIELKNVKHYASMSEETQCFEATVYIDGKKATRVSNRGFGGAHEYDNREVESRLVEYAKTLPSKDITFGERTITVPESADGLIDDALEAVLVEKEEARFRKLAMKDIATRVLYVREGKMYCTTKTADQTLLRRTAEHHAANGLEVLNLMSFETAYPIWRRYAVRGA